MTKDGHNYTQRKPIALLNSLKKRNAYIPDSSLFHEAPF